MNSYNCYRRKTTTTILTRRSKGVSEPLPCAKSLWRWSVSCEERLSECRNTLEASYAVFVWKSSLSSTLTQSEKSNWLWTQKKSADIEPSKRWEWIFFRWSSDGKPGLDSPRSKLLWGNAMSVTWCGNSWISSWTSRSVSERTLASSFWKSRST